MSDRTLQGWLTKKQSWLVKDTLALMMYNVDIAYLMPEVVLEKQILYMSAGLYYIITVYSIFLYIVSLVSLSLINHCKELGSKYIINRNIIQNINHLRYLTRRGSPVAYRSSTN